MCVLFAATRSLKTFLPMLLWSYWAALYLCANVEDTVFIKVNKSISEGGIDGACSVPAATTLIGKFFSTPLVPETRLTDQGAFSFTIFFIPFSVHPPYGG